MCIHVNFDDFANVFQAICVLNQITVRVEPLFVGIEMTVARDADNFFPASIFRVDDVDSAAFDVVLCREGNQPAIVGDGRAFAYLRKAIFWSSQLSLSCEREIRREQPAASISLFIDNDDCPIISNPRRRICISRQAHAEVVDGKVWVCD